MRKYIAADPTDWEARRAWRGPSCMLGRNTEAAREFQACMKGRPDDVRAWRDYLTMLLDQGDLDTFLDSAGPAASIG